MAAVTYQDAEPVTPEMATPPTTRLIGLLLSASMIAGVVIAPVWVWVPLTVLVVGIGSIPSLIGTAIVVVPDARRRVTRRGT